MTTEEALTKIQEIVTEAVARGDNSSYVDRISDVITDQLVSVISATLGTNAVACKVCNEVTYPDQSLMEAHFLRDHPDHYAEYLDWHKQQLLDHLSKYEEVINAGT